MLQNYKIKNSFESQRGATLVEVLIYITILGLIMTASLVSVYRILSSSDSDASRNITEEEVAFVIAKINWALNDISDINLPASPGTSDTTLSVDKNGYASPIVFALSGSDLTIDRGTGAEIINSERVAFTNLNFEYVQQLGSSTADSVRTSFYANGQYFESLKFIR